MDKQNKNVDYSKLPPELQAKLAQWEANSPNNQAAAAAQQAVQAVEEIKNKVGALNPQMAISITNLDEYLKPIQDLLEGLNAKEAPEPPDFAQPVVEALGKLEKALKAIDVKPQFSPNVKVDAPQVSVQAPSVDLSGIAKVLKTDIPKAFDKAIALIPVTEIPDTDLTPLVEKFDEMLTKLDSLETATRIKPQPGTMKVTNPDGSNIASTNPYARPVFQYVQQNAVANGNGSNLNVEGYAAALLNVVSSVAMSGGTTVNFEASVDNVTWVAIMGINQATGTVTTSTTADGDFRFSTGAYKSLRARISAYSAGTVTVKGYVSVLPSPPNSVALSAGTASIGTVDTELPAAVALSDTLANPTTPVIGGANLLWDAVGSQYVRQIQTPADSANLQTGVGSSRNTILLRRTTSDYRTWHTADAGTDALAGANQASTSPMIFNGSTFDRVRTASADTFAATGLLANGNMLFNSSSWDRQRSASALADTASGTGLAAIAGWGYNGTNWDRNRSGAVSNVAAATGFTDALSVGQYNATPPTITDTRYNAMQMDVNANTRVTLATLIAGEDLTANVQGVIQKPVTGSTYAPSTYQQSASVTKANIKASAGNVYMIRITNANAALRYFQLHNKTSAPAAADTAQLYFLVPAGTATAPGILELNINDFAPSEYFTTGIGWAISTTATTFTDSATSGEHNTTVRYV